MRHGMPLCFLCVSVVCCVWSGNGSVQLQNGFIRRNVYWHIADKKGSESADCLQHCRFIGRRNEPMPATVLQRKDALNIFSSNRYFLCINSTSFSSWTRYVMYVLRHHFIISIKICRGTQCPPLSIECYRVSTFYLSMLQKSTGESFFSLFYRISFSYCHFNEGSHV